MCSALEKPKTPITIRGNKVLLNDDFFLFLFFF